jgi:2-keto-3-deoxy-L-rhamnonate aldolase RhmA
MEFLRDRVRSGERVVGTFVKTTSPQTLEILAHAALDFIVLDAEHAPFGIDSLSLALGVASLARLAALVRVPDHDPAFINTCLDMGAEGLVVPHVRSVADVEAIADAVKYARGRRGFSPSSRAGGYGTLSTAAYRSRADARSAIWCQIEDAEALEAVEEIAANDMVDCLLIGPADLSLSLGLDGTDDARLEPAIARIAEAGRRHNRAVGMYVPRAEQIPTVLARLMSVVLCGSDQSMLLEGAKRLSFAMTEIGVKVS